MVTAKHSELSAAFDFVGSGPPMEHNAYISLDTGAIYWISEVYPLDEEVPTDLETSDRYLPVPHKNDLDLGSRLALDFAARTLPESYGLVENLFRHKGAYARFKQLLDSRNVLADWYKFESEAVEAALRVWCADNDIQIIEDDNNESSA